MNELTGQKMTINDLKVLGLQGGATAYLDDGTKVTLKRQFGTIDRKGLVNDELVDVEMIVGYSKIYGNIRTIKRHDVLIARRSPQKKTLLLTGKGYRRDRN